MGYFSEMNLMQYEEAEWSRPTKVRQLTDRLAYLSERLAVLEDQWPHDMSEPCFDRMFYSECLSGSCDDIYTVQGVLQAIRKTEDLLRIAEEEEQREKEELQRRIEWRAAVWETGATPDHQIVLLDAFFAVRKHTTAA